MKTGRRGPLTGAAWSVIGAVVLAYVGGVALGYGPLMVVAGGGLVALAVAAASAAWRPRLRVGRSFTPPTVVAGEDATAVLEARNTSRFYAPPVTVLDRLGATDVELRTRAIPAGRAALVRYRLPTERRGRVALGPLRVVRSDPFGLVQVGQDHGGQDVLWVHPRTWPMSPVPAGVVVTLEGPVSETSPAGSVTFSSLREYRAGDDRRLIHWRSSAKLGTLLVRQNVDTNEPRATVVLDARQRLWTEETFESGVETAASVAKALTAGGREVRLVVLGDTAKRARQLGAVTVADRLAAAELTPIAEPATLLAAIENEPDGGALVVVSGRLETSVQVQIAAHHRRFAPVIVCRVEPDRSPGWRRRPELTEVHGPTAAALAEAWNQMTVA